MLPMRERQRTDGEGPASRASQRGGGAAGAFTQWLLHTKTAILSFHMRFCLKRRLHLKMSLKTPDSQEACGCLGSGQMCLQADQGVHAGARVLFSVWRVCSGCLCVLCAEDKPRAPQPEEPPLCR